MAITVSRWAIAVAELSAGLRQLAKTSLGADEVGLKADACRRLRLVHEHSHDRPYCTCHRVEPNGLGIRRGKTVGKNFQDIFR